MTNSSRAPHPGDSSVDFSNLEEADEAPPWLPPVSDSAVDLDADQTDLNDAQAASRDRSVDDQQSREAALEKADPESHDEERLSDTVVGLPSFESPSESPEQTTAATAEPVAPETLTNESPPSASESITGAATGGTSRRRLLLILLASYASAITLGFLWLLLTRQSADPHELESLPDVAPLDPNAFKYVPQNASMPSGHTLPLGQEERFGHVLVRPLRVTRGPVEFVHYSDGSQTRPKTEPVYKLWLRFKNVSDDQLIAPLDNRLLFKRKYDELGEPELANQLLYVAGSDSAEGRRAFVLDHPESSEWDLKGQQLGLGLKPGESIETYIPTQPGDGSELSGELLWRVHLRKGYHADTGHGVTTLIEVPFHAGDVQTEQTTG